MNVENQSEIKLNDSLVIIRKHIEKKQFRKAIKESLSLLKTYTDSESILLELAKAYYFLSDYNKAKEILYKLLQYRNKYSYIFLSKIYKFEQNLNRAKQYLERAFKLFPKDMEIVVNLIDIYKLLNKNERIGYLTNNIELSSIEKDNNINHMLIRVLRENNFIDISNKFAFIILKNDKNNVKAAIELAYNYIYTSEFIKAEDILYGLKDKNNIELLFVFTELYKYKNDINKFKTFYKKILKNGKCNIGLELSLADLYFLNKKYNKSYAILKKLIKKYPNEKMKIQCLLQNQYRKANKYNKLLNLNREMLKDSADNIDLLTEIIDIYLQKNKFIKALEILFKNISNTSLVTIKEKIYFKILDYVHKKNLSNKRFFVSLFVNKCLKIIPDTDFKIRNSLLNEQEIAEDKIFLLSKPRRMQIVLTNKCNLKCIMCNFHKYDWSFDDKQVKELKLLIPYLEYIVWQGGEVFLHKNFNELFEFAFKNKVKQTIITNGLLITKDIAESIVKFGTELVVSIDSVDKLIYEKIRKNGNFDKLIDNLKVLNNFREQYTSSRFNMKLSVVVMEYNFDKLYDILEFAKKYNFKVIELNPIQIKNGNSEEETFFINPDYQKLKYLNVEILKLITKAKEYGIKVNSSIPSVDSIHKICEAKQNIKSETIVEYIYQNKIQSNGKKSDISDLYGYKNINISNSKIKRIIFPYIKLFLLFINGIFNKKHKYCLIPWQALFIDLNGYIMPGCNCNMFCYDTIEDCTISDIWNSKTMLLYRKRIENNHYETVCTQQCIYGGISIDRRLYL